jgi:hypothetical protein
VGVLAAGEHEVGEQASALFRRHRNPRPAIVRQIEAPEQIEPVRGHPLPPAASATLMQFDNSLTQFDGCLERF